jgi:hypothetical protein
VRVVVVEKASEIFTSSNIRDLRLIAPLLVGGAMSRALHRKQSRLLCLIIGATLVFFLVVLNAKLSGKVAAHVDEELDTEILGQVHHASPEDGGEAEKPIIDRVKKKFGWHVWRLDGLLEVNPQGRHPIYDLVEKAKKKWNAKVARQSKTLKDAVREYRRRYQRDPPVGFDRWCVECSLST